MNTIFLRFERKKLFFLLSFFTLTSFLIILFFFQDKLLKPSTCLCAKIFSNDSTVSLPASKKLVGVGHYVYTIQTARKNCLEQYQNELKEWKSDEQFLEKAMKTENSFFIDRCQEK